MGKIAEWSVSGMEQFCLLLVGDKSKLTGNDTLAFWLFRLLKIFNLQNAKNGL